MGKTVNGEVKVLVFRDRLILRWSYAGDRHTLYLRLPDSSVNRNIAEGKARQIAGNMATGNFDSTLAKYKPQSAIASGLSGGSSTLRGLKMSCLG